MSLPKEQVKNILDSSELTNAEKEIVRWQFELQGSFNHRLFETIASADTLNKAALALAYPEYVEAMIAWQQRDLAQRINRIADYTIV